MTYAELMRKYATDATNDGGMWFSGEYMSRFAAIAKSLESENAKLRERIAELEGLYVKSKAESAKLRELAGIMAYCMQERNCDWCKVNGGTGEVTEPAGCDVLLDLLRELGVMQ